MINLDGLRWTSYNGTDWTIARHINEMYGSDLFRCGRNKVLGGKELILRGDELITFKDLYHVTHGVKLLRVNGLGLMDRDRVTATYAWLNRNTTLLSTHEESPPVETYESSCSDAESTHSASAHTESVLGNGVPEDILNTLMEVTNRHGLHWVRYGGGVYLPMVEACLAKGMERDDYSSNWKGKGLPGISHTLDDLDLGAFKSQYIYQYGSWPFPHTKSLNIGDWEHAYGYLVQGKSPTATTFQTMGAKSIQQVIEGPTPTCPESWSSEKEMVDKVFRLMEYSPISMQREACFVNTLSEAPATRRVDAIEHLPPGEDGVPKINIYEFKQHNISCDHIVDTVGTKGYLQLVRKKYPDAKVCLFMVGNGIDPQAQELLDYMVGVAYMPLSVLLNKILLSIYNSWPSEAHYALGKHYISNFRDILPPEMLKGPIVQSSLKVTYLKPIRGK